MAMENGKNMGAIFLEQKPFLGHPNIHKAHKSFRTPPPPKNSPIGPKKAKNDPKKAKNEKVRKQKFLQNKSYQS